MEPRSAAAHTFDHGYFERLHRAPNHWWLRGMRAAAESLLAGRSGPLRILDAGCGTGSNLGWAARQARGPRVRAIELHREALLHAQDLHAPADLLQASVTAIPFADATFDLVVCWDVLQHLTTDDERAAVREFARVLVPRGRLLARTGARWGRARVPEREDWRLYTPAHLARIVADGGLTVRRLTYANALPALWAAAVTLLGRPGRRGEGVPGLGLHRPAPRWKDKLLGGVLSIEAAWVRRKGAALPFGHSLYVLAEKDAPGTTDTRSPVRADR